MVAVAQAQWVVASTRVQIVVVCLQGQQQYDNTLLATTCVREVCCYPKLVLCLGGPAASF